MTKQSPSPLYVCWTTVDKAEDAERLASGAIESGLAACVQIDAPMTSVYAWQGQTQRADEIRIWLKTTAQRLDALQRFVLDNHPYDTPQWLAVAAEKVAEKYLKWAQ